ncbi:MAG: TetR/AcrR family transcriptional regulator [Pseudomonadota bacterium]
MPKDTRTELLDLAERAVRSRGFDAFSYADLASAIGIRKASIHYHFPTKADLSDALMTRYRARFSTLLADINAEHPTGAARIRALTTLYRTALHDGSTLCLCVSFTSSVESLTPAVRTQIKMFREMMASWIETSVVLGAKDGTVVLNTPAANEARAVLALLEGAHLAARADGDLSRFDDAVVGLLERLKE